MNDFEEMKNFGQPPEHLVKASREADRTDKERAELFAVMVKTDAWKEYEKLLRARVEAQSSIVLEPAQSVDRCLGLEYEKGTMRGLIIARDLPELIIQAAKQIHSDPETD